MNELKWKGVDNGREKQLRTEGWFGVLKVLSENEGASITDFDGKLYRDLFSMDDSVSWTGKDGDRSFFRDYQAPWIRTGVMEPTGKTKGLIRLTPAGRKLVSRGEGAVKEFFRQYIDSYSEEFIDSTDGTYKYVSPFEQIAHAIVLEQDGNPELQIEKVRKTSELLMVLSLYGANVAKFLETDRQKRKFNSYLIYLENAHAVRKDGSNLEVLDESYIKQMVRPGLDFMYPTEQLPIELTYDQDVFKLPDNVTDDLRRRSMTNRVVREGQGTFERKVMKAYAGRCCVTGTGERGVLEAAHILDYRGRQTNFVSNGMMMAADIHRLFDRGRLLINPETYTIELSPEVLDSRYRALEGAGIILPADRASWPNQEALKMKYERSRAANRKKGASGQVL